MWIFRVNREWVRRSPMMATLIGGMVLWPWHLEAQTQKDPPAQAQLKPQKLVQSGEPEQKSEFYRIIKVGDYTLKIGDAASIQAVGATPEEKERIGADRLHAAEKAPGTGHGDAQGDRPNLNLWLDIKGRTPEETLLIQGVYRLRAQDEQGRALRYGNMPYRAELLFAHPDPEAGRRATIDFQKEIDARSVQTLEGEFVVTNGVVHTLEFSGDDLHPGTLKRQGPVNATFDSLERAKHTVTVHITCKSIQFQPPDPTNSQELQVQRTLGRRDVQAEAVGTDGITYKTNGISASFHRERPSTVGKDGVARRDDTIPAMVNFTSHLTFNFDTMPEGVRPQKVILHVVEQQGENFHVPFKFTDISLADLL